jgi:erythronate-4-phosphate dehydrogenase
MLNEQTFKWLKPSAVFINAARGEVVDTTALYKAITHKKIGPTIIDVWEHEPKINWDLFQAVTLGTPHIAGHSLDGKANGTFMIYAALCKHLDIEPTWNPVQSLPPPIVPLIEVNTYPQSGQEQLRQMVTKIYDIVADYGRMQELLVASQNERPTLFDALRKNYPVRREFHRTKVKLPKHRRELRQIIGKLGFSEVNEDP